MTSSMHTSKESKLSVRKAILAAHLVITIPSSMILIGSYLIGRSLLSSLWWLFAIGGFILAWLWWAYTIPRWRKWAIEKGAPADELHAAAVKSLLEWPKGWIFEKTEIKVITK